MSNRPFGNLTMAAATGFDFTKLPARYSNLSPEQRRLVRQEYAKRQDYRCHYCEGPLNEDPPARVLDIIVDENRFPPNFFEWPLHLHHDHQTDRTIGTVHAYCNAVLWQHHGE